MGFIYSPVKGDTSKRPFQKVGPCLYRYLPNGVYYGRFKVDGKEIRCSLETIQIVRPSESMADTQPKLHPALLSLSAISSPGGTRTEETDQKVPAVFLLDTATGKVWEYKIGIDEDGKAYEYWKDVRN